MAKKKRATKRPSPRNTIEVDMAWLEQVPPTEPPRSAKPSERASSRPSKVPRRDTIEVDRRWLVPPLPALPTEPATPTGAGRKQPPPLPPAAVAKPRAKLPPPIPRVDESVEGEAPRSQSRSGRTSKRPPPGREG
jgi:hypothetical protein